MTLFEQINQFAREFVNDKSTRSSWKRARIREAYKILTGEKIKVTCSTCYIEALMLILKNTTMAARNYELKKGVLLQAFGDPTRTCTNDTLTDELAVWHLSRHPEKAILFSKLPMEYRNAPPPGVTIIKPVKAEEVKEEPNLMKETLEAINKPPVKKEVKKPYKAKK